MMNKIKYIFLILPVLLFQIVLAQPRPGDGRGSGNGRMREKVEQKINTMKIWQLTEAIDLSSEQSEKFFPIYNKFRKNVDSLMNEKRVLIDKLDMVSDSTGLKKGVLEGYISAISKIDGDIANARDSFLNEISAVISLKQMAKLIVFEERFRHRMRERINDIRREFRRNKIGEAGE